MKAVAALVCLMCTMGSSLLVASDLPIFPKPRQIEDRNEWLKLDKSTSILLPQQPSSDDLSLGRFLTVELSDRFGVALQMKQAASLPEKGPFILLGAMSNPLVRQYCSRHPQPPPEEEGYTLTVDQQEAVVAGNDPSGAFYGLQSLRQLIERTEPAFMATWNFADTAELLGWYEVEYNDGFIETVPLRYGVNILEADWQKGSGPKSLAYEARMAPRSDGTIDFAFEWINPRFGIPIREVRLRSVSNENPVTLSGVQAVHKRLAGLNGIKRQEK